MLAALAPLVGVADASDDLEALESTLAARLSRVAAHVDAELSTTAIARARAAIDRAAKAEDPQAATRQLEIGHAALVLAERQIERRGVQTELIETRRRVTETRERAAAQRRVLEALLKERAAVVRAGEAP